MRRFIVLVSHQSVRYLVKVSRYRVFQIQRNAKVMQKSGFATKCSFSFSGVAAESRLTRRRRDSEHVQEGEKLFKHHQEDNRKRNTFTFLSFVSAKLSRTNRGFLNSASNRPWTHTSWINSHCVCAPAGQIGSSSAGCSPALEMN